MCVYMCVYDKQTALQALNQPNPQFSQQKEVVMMTKNIARKAFKQCYRPKYQDVRIVLSVTSYDMVLIV